MTTVLITGVDGRIGRVTAVVLREAGYQVTGLALDDNDPVQGLHRRVVGDAGDPEVVADALLGARFVVHLAAIPHPTLADPLTLFRSNTQATFAVIAAAAERGISRVVLASSINATGIPMNPNGVLPAYFPLDEELPPDIADAYSLAKAVDEQTARMAWRLWGLTTVALRFPYVDSARALELARSQEGPHLRIREGWAYLEVTDAARAILAALRAPVEGALVVGVAADDLLLDSPGGGAEAAALYASAVPVREHTMPAYGLVDTRRAREQLGFEPTFHLTGQRWIGQRAGQGA